MRYFLSRAFLASGCAWTALAFISSSSRHPERSIFLKSHMTDKKPFSELEGCSWPDPDPGDQNGGILVNDVSQMSETRVDRIFFPRTEEDVHAIMKKALDDGKGISMRGTQHSMGGHSCATNSYLVDSKFLGDMDYSTAREEVTVGTGCTWSDVILFLNECGKSPITMQSYASFSIGGTLAVNAHGITSDHVLAEDVVSFRLVRYVKSGHSVRVETIVCTPPQPGQDPQNDAEELFGLALGGYGLFGVITQVTLKVTDNVNLELDSMQLNLLPADGEKDSDFVRVYDAARLNGDVNVKLARLDILTLDKASLYLFRQSSPMPTVTKLGLKPREMSKMSRLLYKWALPLLKDVRQSREEQTGSALDLSPESFSRNALVHESATPLSKLYSPLVVVNDTFVLAEFFVPRDKFSPWIESVKPIFGDIQTYQQKMKSTIVLLNTSIRFVERDSRTFLSYSTAAQGMFCFVLYFRVVRTQQAEQQLGIFHNLLAQKTLDVGGTFYLPYRKSYTLDQLQQAYPQTKAFAKLKQKHDYLGLFVNGFYTRYLEDLDYPNTDRKKGSFSLSEFVDSDTDKASHLRSQREFTKLLPRSSDPSLMRRKDSYRALLGDKHLRQQFAEMFLVNIFHVEKPDEVMRIMTRAAWDPRNVDDDMIYAELYRHFSQKKLPAAALANGWRALQQLSRQKRELTREIATITNRLNRYGNLEGYVSIGDHGKIVSGLWNEGILADGKVWVVHDFTEDDEVSLSCILERGSMHPVGHERLQYDYVNDDATEKLSDIPSESVDLVTLNQGLHHFPPEKLHGFLQEVHRMLRPAGLFIVREHDLDVGWKPGVACRSTIRAPVSMLDLAHSVFNAVTGVPPHVDASEIRAFRPIEEWRAILREVGFIDTMLYGIEEGDSTNDFMMAFQKCGEVVITIDRASGFRHSELGSATTLEQPPIVGTLQTILSQVPSSVVSMVESIVVWFLQKLPKLKNKIEPLLFHQIPLSFSEAAESSNNLLSPDQIEAISSALGKKVSVAIDRLLDLVSGARELLGDIQIRETTNIAGLLSMPELWLILPALKRRVLMDKASALEKDVVEVMEPLLPSLFQAEPAPVDRSVDVPIDLSADELLRSSGGGMERAESVNSDEIMSVALLMGEKIPGLLDPEQLLPATGFTLTQQTALIGFLGATDLKGICHQVALYCDKDTWEECKYALVGDGIPNSISERQSVMGTGALPTKEVLFAVDHPWQRALKALLKSRKVRLKPQAVVGARIIGLSEFVRLYNEAKESAIVTETVTHGQSNGVSGRDLQTLEHHMRTIAAKTDVKTVKLLFRQDKTRYELRDVGEILLAEFGYRSLTSDLTDVTDELRALHNEMLHQRRKGRDQSPIGSFFISEHTLQGFRNKRTAGKALDSLRQVVVVGGTLGFAGQNVLKLKYRPLAESSSSDEATEDFRTFLDEKNLVDFGPRLHSEDANFAWFRLCEWMEVEIIERLGSSLQHTPWYYFPYREFLDLYFRTLLKECEVVALEYGPVKAYTSMAFLTYAVPGVVMALLFGELQLLAAPLAKFLPTYSDDVKVEEIVFYGPSVPETDCTPYFRQQVDERIREVSAIWMSLDNSLPSLYRAIVPTYRTMGEVLVNLAMQMPSAHLLQISGQTAVQVRITVHAPTLSEHGPERLELVKNRLANFAGVAVLFDYRYPNDRHAARLQGEIEDPIAHVATKVDVQSLLPLVREVFTWEGVVVAHIFEFFT